MIRLSDFRRSIWGTGLLGVVVSFAMRKSEGFKSLVFHQYGWVPEPVKRGGL